VKTLIKCVAGLPKSKFAELRKFDYLIAKLLPDVK